MFQKLWRQAPQFSAVCWAIAFTTALWSPAVFAEDDVANADTSAAKAQATQLKEGLKEGLKVGMVAPDFSLSDDTGVTQTLSEYRGKKNVVLAFYPKDFTGG